MESFVAIKSGGDIYGIDSQKVSKILNPVSITSVPLVDEAIRGVCTIEGNITLVLSLAKILKKEEQESHKMVVIEHRDAFYALLVDDILDIEFVDEVHLEKSENEEIDFFYQLGDSICQVLNIDMLLEKIELLSFTPLELADVESEEEEIKRDEEHLKPFIFFEQMEEFYAVDTFLAKELMLVNRVITPMPNSPQEILGVTIVRDRSVVVVGMAELLFGQSSTITPSSRLLNMQVEDKEISFLIEKVCDIKPLDLSKIEPIENPRFQGIYKDGDDIVSVLEDSYLRELCYKYGTEVVIEEENQSEGEMVELAAFKIANEEFAFKVEYIQEVIKYTKITPVPDSSTFVKGVINLRGDVIPVISLPKRLGYEESNTKDTKIIVVNIEDHKIGFLVDDVQDILFVEERYINKSDKEESVVDSIVNLDNGKRVILVLDILKLYNKEEIEEIRGQCG